MSWEITIGKAWNFFRKKIDFLFKDLEGKTALTKYDIVHATTLFSDGAIALKIKKKLRGKFVFKVHDL